MQPVQTSDFGDSGPNTEQMMSPLERDALPPGSLLGGCQIIEALGSDGLSIVYLASDGALQRQVLIKEHFPSRLAGRQGLAVSLLPGADAEKGAEALDAFLKEARLLARLDHPAIVRVHRFWEEHHTAYMMLPFQPSQTLAAVLQRLERPPGEDWLRALLGPVLSALQVLHDQDCWHLGLSPDTISLLPGARPILLDLSSASLVAGGRRPDDADSLDRLYAPIEQFSHGADLGTGPWSDLYALAAVMHHAMLGRPPVSAAVLGPDDRLVTLAESLAGRPDVSYSAAFVAAIDQALAVRPKDRPQSVAAFQRLLALSDAAALASAAAASAPGLRPPLQEAAAAKPAAPAAPVVPAPLPPEAAQPAVSPLAQPPLDEPAAPVPADAEAVDPAVSAAIALAISSLPWEAKHEPTLAGTSAPAGPVPEPLDLRIQAPLAPAREPAMSAESVPARGAGARVQAAAPRARRRTGRWAAATAGLLVAVFGGWYLSSLQPGTQAQLAGGAGGGAASAPQAAPRVEPAPAVAATRPAETVAEAGFVLPEAPTAAGPAASGPIGAGSASGSASGPLLNSAAAVDAAAATATAAAASAPAEAGAKTAAASEAGAPPVAPRAAARSKPAERGSARTPAVAAAGAGTETAAASPRAACGARTNFSLEYCMQTQCKQARFSRHPQCRALR